MTCCPDHPRIEGVETRDGRTVSDLHRHKRMLRGFIAGEAGAVVWHTNGRLTPLAETDVDLVLGGAK